MPIGGGVWGGVGLHVRVVCECACMHVHFVSVCVACANWGGHLRFVCVCVCAGCCVRRPTCSCLFCGVDRSTAFWLNLAMGRTIALLLAHCLGTQRTAGCWGPPPHTPPPASDGANHALCKAKGIPPAELASKLGLSPPHIACLWNRAGTPV